MAVCKEFAFCVKTLESAVGSDRSQEKRGLIWPFWSPADSAGELGSMVLMCRVMAGWWSSCAMPTGPNRVIG